jgi:hypothetical protein
MKGFVNKKSTELRNLSETSQEWDDSYTNPPEIFVKQNLTPSLLQKRPETTDTASATTPQNSS